MEGAVEGASPYRHDHNLHQAVGVGAYDDPKKQTVIASHTLWV